MGNARQKKSPRKLGRSPLGQAEGRCWIAVVGECQAGNAKAIGEKPEVTDAHEPSGKHVQKEAPQELSGAKRHLGLLAAVGVILPAKGDALLLEGQQAMIGDGHAMGVAAEIAQYLQGSGGAGGG